MWRSLHSGRCDVVLDVVVGAGEERDTVVAVLDRAARAIDDLWRCADREGREVAISLGEASLAVHRALIVLSCDETQGLPG
jgi:hypothetical protein